MLGLPPARTASYPSAKKDDIETAYGKSGRLFYQNSVVAIRSVKVDRLSQSFLQRKDLNFGQVFYLKDTGKVLVV